MGGGGGGGETRLLVECDEKRDQAKGKALEFFSQNFVVSGVQETWINLILRQNERQGTERLGFPSLPYLVFLPLPLASVRAVFRAYADVITRFLGTIGSKIFFSYGAPLKRLF